MARSARDLAVRFGIDQLGPAQALYRGMEFARYFARGYRWARDLPTVPRFASASGREEPSELEKLAEAHISGPGIIKWEHYFDIYDRHLTGFRGRDVYLVEIGVYGGGSVGLWRDYLGSAAHICGVDIDPECKRFEADGIEIVVGDQGVQGFWESFVRTHPQIDIVIDDGGHLPEQQAVTLECLLPHIRPGGVYVCEDIHGAFQPFHAFLDGLTRRLSEVEAPPSDPTRANSLQRQVASVHHYPILTVIEKHTVGPRMYESRRYGTEWPDEQPRQPAPTILAR
jgi:Methyltransferase domain